MSNREVIEYTANITKKITITRSLKEKNVNCHYRVYIGTELFSIAQTYQEALKKAGKYAEKMAETMEEKPFLYFPNFDVKMNILINENRYIVNHLMEIFPEIKEAMLDATISHQELSRTIELYKQQRARAEKSDNKP